MPDLNKVLGKVCKNGAFILGAAYKRKQSHDVHLVRNPYLQ